MQSMKNNRRGIILAGGSGSRLFPVTRMVTKSLLPVYDKPMIYYPLYTLMKAGIKDILVISTPESTPVIARNLGDGSQYGCRFTYRIQEKPDGLAQAFVLGREFIGKDKVCLILGDNIFYGTECQKLFRQAAKSDDNIVFGYQVADPERYGVVEFDDAGNALSIEEKPKKPKSNYAVPGIYFYNNDVVDIAANLKPSARGEYEITDVNREYLKRKDLKVMKLGLGNAYLDTGTFQSLSDASNFIRTIEERTGLRVSDIEEFRIHEKDINL